MWLHLYQQMVEFVLVVVVVDVRAVVLPWLLLLRMLLLPRLMLLLMLVVPWLLVNIDA
jgi:hypothetical protein